jgi:hypothetical protein
MGSQQMGSSPLLAKNAMTKKQKTDLIPFATLAFQAAIGEGWCLQ